MSYKHPNSKTVTIFRARSFVAEAQKGLDDFFASATKSIGSYWESISSKKVGSGLSVAEQNLLMPYLIDLEVEDREFRKKVKEFFDEINTKVPYKDGLKLEVGLSEDNSKPLSKTNLPLNVMDYVRWRHALGHPQVASSKESALGNQLITFYIFDPTALQDANKGLIAARDKALEYYLLLKKDADKVDNFLAMLGEDPRAYESFEDKIQVLHSMINSEIEKVEDFIDIYEDPKLENKALLEKMVIFGVLKKVGTRYIVAETDQILGNSQEEALFEMEDEPKNGTLLTVLKAQLQEKQKAKVQAKRKAGVK